VWIASYEKVRSGKMITVLALLASNCINRRCRSARGVRLHQGRKLTASPASCAFVDSLPPALSFFAQCCPALAQSFDEQLALARSWASSLQVRLSQAKVTVGSPLVSIH